MLEPQENHDKIADCICRLMSKGGLENEHLVQLSELCLAYLNAETIPNYAKQKGLSYNGVKKTRDIREIRGVKFVIDND